jgi:hypothetical protein
MALVVITLAARSERADEENWTERILCYGWMDGWMDGD